jgi:hypothetical protein
MDQISKVEILAACDAIRTRFAGRAKLRELASRDAIARAELQRRLGLIDDATFAGLERAALRVAATGGKSGNWAAGRLAAIRDSRAKTKTRPSAVVSHRGASNCEPPALNKRAIAVLARRWKENCHG